MNRIGRYRIDGVLGAGSFATVFAGFDESLDADVAVKVLADNWARDPDVRLRFINEARLLRRHANPALVAVHDIGETDDGRPYFVMERANGGSLAERLEAGDAVSDADIVRIVQTLVAGLGALHSAGVVHRDVSPGNVLIRGGDGGDGLVGADEKIVMGDLGLAKDLEMASGLTISGGTRGYMAPEQQHAGAVVSAASDIYAASALVCHVLTGRPPEPDGALGTRQRERLGPAMTAAVRSGLATQPERRPRTIDAWGEAIIGALEVGLTRERRRWPAVAVVLVVLAVVALAWWSAMPGVAVDGPARLEVGVRSTYTAVASDATSVYWTDWNGTRIDGAEFWIEPSTAGTLTFTLTAVAEDGTTTTVERTVVVDDP